MSAICKHCEEEFKWDDNVVRVEDVFYHDSCVKLYPAGYVAFTVDDEFIGETENDDGDMAYNYFDGLLDD